MTVSELITELMNHKNLQAEVRIEVGGDGAFHSTTDFKVIEMFDGEVLLSDAL